MKATLWVPALAVLAATIAGCGGGGAAGRLTPAVQASVPVAPAPTASATSSDSPMLTTYYISKASAEKIALAAVHGGTVTLAVLETSDYPVHWSIDIVNRTGEYEVWVNARTGKVLAIIKGG